MDRLNNRFPIARFGASTVNHNGTTYIFGGTIRDRLLEASEEVCSIKYEDGDYAIQSITLEYSETVRPLLVGITMVSTPDSLIMLGGSAVCFSFGTFWNKGCYTLAGLNKAKSANDASAQQPIGQEAAWKYQHTINARVLGTGPKVLTGLPTLASDPVQNLTVVSRLRLQSPVDFTQVVQTGKPIILEGLDIGTCTSDWTATYLKERVGVEREVCQVTIQDNCKQTNNLDHCPRVKC